MNAKTKVFVASAVVAVVTASLVFLNFFVIDPGSKPPQLTVPGNQSLEFERTVYDTEKAHALEQVNQKVVLAGPLFRKPNTPINFVEMSPDLKVLGVRELEDNFFYAASGNDDGAITFMGGGCTDKSGAWASCSQVTTLTTDSEIVDKSSVALELDFHEYEEMAPSEFWAIRYSTIDCAIDSTKHCGEDASGEPVPSIGDCHIVHIKDNQIISDWSAYENLPDGESTSIRYGESSDIFHCNSIDAFEIDGEPKFLISLRNTDSIYLVDAASGDVDWKIGGKNWAGVSLEISNPGALGISKNSEKPELILSGQHDARYWGEGIFSVFDNRSKTGLPARGIVFSVDDAQGSMTVEKVFNDPEGNPSGCTGSFRQLDRGNYWVAGWGCSNSGITVFDDETRAIVSTKLDSNSIANQEITDESMGFLRWTLSYRVIVD